MDIKTWVKSRPRVAREKGIREAARLSRNQAARFFLRKANKFDYRGTPIFEEDWDVLIILDACRADMLEQVAKEYDFLPGSVPTVRSLASASKPWMEQNFTEEYRSEIARTTYVTGNPYSAEELDSHDLQMLDEVWKYGWDQEIGTVPARRITDRAIRLSREERPNRMILHYMQPHFPSIPKPLADGINLDQFGDGWNSVWRRLKEGSLESGEIWESYVMNLKYVLDDLELLLENLAAENVVISADHGNSFGKWGTYGHPPGIPTTELRKVPWVRTTARDTHSYQQENVEERSEVSEDTVESRLEALGYK